MIDTYELHSGINIQQADLVNCYYDENSKTRIALYDLKQHPDVNKFQLVSESESGVLKILHSSFLENHEKPGDSNLYIATGNKFGSQWIYLLESETGRLWAELQY